MSKNLSFKMGTSGNRNIIHGTRLGPNEGQVIFDYNSTLNGENNFYPYTDYQIDGVSTAKKPNYDVKIYLDINDTNRIPLTTKFSDYSSKLWDLSTGTEFNCGNNGRPIFFSNGTPYPAKFKIETIHRATLGTTPNTFKVSIDTDNDDQAIIKLPCNFGICSTAGDTAAKTVTVDISGNTPFILGNGIKVTILFQNGNTATLSNVTLNVNDTGAKKIKIGDNSNLPANFIQSGQICHFTYYNNYWYLDSSPVATATQNGLLSVNSQQIEGQKYFLKSVLLANGFEFRGPNAVPLASLKGSNIGNSENGLVTLTLGSIASAVDQGKGCIKLYNNEVKTTTLTTYSNDINTSNQTIYFRNYGSTDNYFVTTNTPLRVGGSDDTNGNKPVYISDKGVATACDGIVVTNTAQTFDGDKTFKKCIKIDHTGSLFYAGTKEFQYNIFSISVNDDDENSILYLDNYGIQTLDKTGNPNQLYLNPDGGEINLGTQLMIFENSIQSVVNIHSSLISADDLYINIDGGNVYFGTYNTCINEEGKIIIQNDEISTSSTTGALIVKGGIGVAKTSYMTSILPNTTMSSQLGGFDNVWSNIFCNDYLIHDGTNGHYNNEHTGGRIRTEVGTATDGNLVTEIILGNGLSNTIGNRKGSITLYSNSSGYTTIEKRSNTTGISKLYLPNETGYIAYITSITESTGATNKPVYVNANGKITPCSNTYGGNAKHMYILGGSFTTSTANIGQTNTPMYMSNGTFTACAGIVVTTGQQTFAGEKTFKENIFVKGTENGDYGFQTFYSTNSCLWLWANPNNGTRGLWDTNYGDIIEFIAAENYPRLSGIFKTVETAGFGTSDPPTITSTDADENKGRIYFKIID